MCSYWDLKFSTYTCIHTHIFFFPSSSYLISSLYLLPAATCWPSRSTVSCLCPAIDLGSLSYYPGQLQCITEISASPTIAYGTWKVWPGQNLLLAGCRLRRADGRVPVQVWRPESWESDVVSFSPSPKVECCQKVNSLLFDFLFYSSLQWIGWNPPTVGRTICFLSLLIQVLSTSRNSHTDTPRMQFSQIFGPPMSQSRGSIKFTIPHIS